MKTQSKPRCHHTTIAVYDVQIAGMMGIGIRMNEAAHVTRSGVMGNELLYLVQWDGRRTFSQKFEL